MTKRSRPATLRFEGARPMAFGRLAGSAKDLQEPSREDRLLVKAAAQTLKAYRSAAKELLDGRLSHLRGFAPPYLTNPGSAVVACCPGGVVVRHETATEQQSQLVGAWMPETFASVASTLSQNLVWVRSASTDPPPPQDYGIKLGLHISNQTNQEHRTILDARITFEIFVSGNDPPIDPLGRPPRIASIHNSLIFQIHGVLEAGHQHEHPFILQSKIRLPVGWDCVELYPSQDRKLWQPERAAAWAEADILAAAVSHQAQEAALHSLDPNSEVRRRFSALFKQFETLISEEPAEEIIQVFLHSHPELLCPTYIHMWPKLSLGASVTDFVFKDAKDEYVLVELERSTHSLFNKNGHSSAALNHARGQILDWLRYIGDNKHTVEKELGLVGISTSPRALIVIGRSANLTAANRSKLRVMAEAEPRISIITYDDLLSNARAIVDNLFGPDWDLPSHTRVLYPTGFPSLSTPST